MWTREGRNSRTEKKEQMSGLVMVKGMPRSLIQPSWKGTVAGSSTGAMLGFTMPPVAGFSAAMPLMPAGSGAGPPARPSRAHLNDFCLENEEVMQFR